MLIIERILAISDIHGCYDELNNLLEKAKYDSTKDQLILLGDYIDRGKDNLKTLEMVKDLVDNGVIALRGNHDQMFLDFVTRPYIYSNTFNYLRNGGDTTLRNMIKDFDSYQWHEDSYVSWATDIMTEYEHLINFVSKLPYYHKIDNYVFVHAGVNPSYDSWEKTPYDEMVWIREQFLNNDLPFEETFVHGHTPAVNLHGKHDVFFNGNKIGIDGACAYGGQLNCLEIKDGKFKQYEVIK